MANFGKIQLLGNSRSDKDVAGSKRHTLTRLNDTTGQHEVVTQFESMDEMVEAMNIKDENGRDRYHNDPSFRISVQEMAANSPALLAEPTIARKSPIPTDAEFLAGLRRDAIIERRNALVDAAGGNNAAAKYELALALTDPANAESAFEMQATTEPATPYADFLKARKQAGEGPLAWTFAVDADKAIGPASDDVAPGVDSIITLDEWSS